MIETEFFTFVTGQASDVGCRREINEDGFLSSPEAGLWAVADGMGGHAAGDYASQTIVAELFSIGRPGSPEDLEARFMSRLFRANETIVDHAAELNKGTIGSTVVALLVFGREYSCIWSGDSRLYLMRQGTLQQVSRDHTEVRALLESGAISQEEADNWPRKNVITRAVGVTETPECEVIRGELAEGDWFLLCSDGLNEHLSDQDIEQFMKSVQSPQELCDALIKETLSRGAKDNVTVVSVQFLAPPPAVVDQELEQDTGGW